MEIREAVTGYIQLRVRKLSVCFKMDYGARENEFFQKQEF